MGETGRGVGETGRGSVRVGQESGAALVSGVIDLDGTPVPPVAVGAQARAPEDLLDQILEREAGAARDRGRRLAGVMPGRAFTSSTTPLPRSLTMRSTRVAPRIRARHAPASRAAAPSGTARATGAPAGGSRCGRRVLGAEVVEAAPGRDLTAPSALPSKTATEISFPSTKRSTRTSSSKRSASSTAASSSSSSRATLIPSDEPSPAGLTTPETRTTRAAPAAPRRRPTARRTQARSAGC